MFAVGQMEQMQDRFKKDYCARWHGEVRGRQEAASSSPRDRQRLMAHSRRSSVNENGPPAHAGGPFLLLLNGLWL